MVSPSSVTQISGLPASPEGPPPGPAPWRVRRVVRDPAPSPSPPVHRTPAFKYSCATSHSWGQWLRRPRQSRGSLGSQCSQPRPAGQRTLPGPRPPPAGLLVSADSREVRGAWWPGRRGFGLCSCPVATLGGGAWAGEQLRRWGVQTQGGPEGTQAAVASTGVHDPAGRWDCPTL